MVNNLVEGSSPTLNHQNKMNAGERNNIKPESIGLGKEQDTTLDPDFENVVSSYGTMKYSNGNIYEGQLLNGKRSGNGKMYFENGDIYTGMWKSDQMCDHEGEYIFSNQNSYKGSFQMCTQFDTGKFGMIHG